MDNGILSVSREREGERDYYTTTIEGLNYRVVWESCMERSWKQVGGRP